MVQLYAHQNFDLLQNASHLITFVCYTKLLIVLDSMLRDSCWSWLDDHNLHRHKHARASPLLILCTCCVKAPTSSKPEAYQVPANFDKSILGEVDVSSKTAAELGLPHAFWLRWMQLREQVRASLLAPTMQCSARRVSCFA